MAADFTNDTAFNADLPVFAGEPAADAINLRAALLQRDLERAHRAADILRDALTYLSSRLEDRPDLQSRARDALLRAALA